MARKSAAEAATERKNGLLAVLYRPVSELVPYARNARTHSQEQIAQIVASMKEFGWTNPVLVDGSGGIVAGHGRVLAAQQLGLQDVPCIRLAHLTEAQKKAYALADNKLALNAGWDEELLRLELLDLKGLEIDLDLTGFGPGEIDDILLGRDIEQKEYDESAADDVEFLTCPKCGHSLMRTLLSKIEDYPAHLEGCWREHLAPREPDAPTVISLFAGCGGSSLGYSMAGYRELLAVEWDEHAVETFKLNFPDVPVWQGDIADLTVEECLRITGLQPGELDVLDGSPPCQGFSTAGRRKMEDGRNQLFKEYVRLLRGLQPKVMVMENVRGMVLGKMKLIFAEIITDLKASGYRVSARLMNAMYFGVPQSRERMIFIGVREDLAA